MQPIIHTSIYASPCGDLILGDYQGNLCLCDWTNTKHRQHTDHKIQQELNAVYQEGTTDLIKKTHKELDEYFAGVRTEFDLPLWMTGTTFQQRVWQSLQQIPYGRTISYREQAQRLGNPLAVRAVASANGRNPICIIVPCPRVIGSNRQLTGFAGGIEVKRVLLELEQKHSPQNSILFKGYSL